MIQPDFTEARFTFFEKNKESFEDTEENKLEHTDVFKDYIMILEQIIEAKLKVKYSDDEIDAFYLTFKDNLKQYEQINSETVDTIFGFTNFDKFKNSLLVYKRGIDEGSLVANKEAEETALPLESMVDQDQESLLKIFNDLNSEDTSDPKSKWKKTLEIKETEGYGCLV